MHYVSIFLDIMVQPLVVRIETIKQKSCQALQKQIRVLMYTFTNMSDVLLQMYYIGADMMICIMTVPRNPKFLLIVRFFKVMTVPPQPFAKLVFSIELIENIVCRISFFRFNVSQDAFE